MDITTSHFRSKVISLLLVNSNHRTRHKLYRSIRVRNLFSGGMLSTLVRVNYSCVQTRGGAAGERTDTSESCEERTSRVSSRLSSASGVNSEDDQSCHAVVVHPDTSHRSGTGQLVVVVSAMLKRIRRFVL